MKNKIINLLKDTKAGLFISLCFSFMIMIYEPLNIFVSNRSDFDFDIYYFFPLIILQWLSCFIALYLIFLIAKLIHKNVYRFVVVSFFIILICSYIQGNFLAGSLPGIDGDPVDFSEFGKEKILTIIIFIIVSIVVIFTLIKYKFKTVEKVTKYSSLFIMGMLFISMLSFPFSEGFFKHSNYYYASTDYINEFSSDKNYIIFLLDAVSSTKFNNELDSLGKKESLFEDFTYYPDTLGGYPFTRNTIPFIFSGNWFENKEDFTTYISESLGKSKVFNKLESEGYLLDFYERDLAGYNGENYERLRNIKKLEKYGYKEIFEEEMKIVLYKYLPYQLKSLAHAETFDMTRARKGENVFDYNDVIAYERYKNEDVEVVDDKIFHYIHLEGAHNPQRYDINLNIVEDGTHEGNMDACITLLELFLNKLKENNLYDNSVIVVLSDHGYNKTAEDRQNPILYIKGINEKHEYRVSDKKVSFVNLADSFIELSDGKQSDELFEGLDNSVRRYFFYRFTKEYKMYEMEQTGYAWDTSTLQETGNIFKR